MVDDLELLLKFIEDLLQEEYHWLQYSDYHGFTEDVKIADHCGKQLNLVRNEVLEIIRKEYGQLGIL